MTLNSPLSTQPLELESTTNYESQSQPNQNLAITGQKSTDSNRIGDYWEYYVILEAWSRGAEVFKNAGTTGSIDLILVWNDMLLKCDVKQKIQTQPGYYGACRLGKGNDRTIISVHPITREIKWVRGKEPKGWEDFWN